MGGGRETLETNGADGKKFGAAAVAAASFCFHFSLDQAGPKLVLVRAGVILIGETSRQAGMKADKQASRKAGK